MTMLYRFLIVSWMQITCNICCWCSCSKYYILKRRPFSFKSV